MAETKLTRYYRCQGFGYMAANCERPDRTRPCWTLGKEGHRAAMCDRTPPLRRKRSRAPDPSPAGDHAMLDVSGGSPVEEASEHTAVNSQAECVGARDNKDQVPDPLEPYLDIKVLVDVKSEIPENLEYLERNFDRAFRDIESHL